MKKAIFVSFSLLLASATFAQTSAPAPEKTSEQSAEQVPVESAASQAASSPSNASLNTSEPEQVPSSQPAVSALAAESAPSSQPTTSSQATTSNTSNCPSDVPCFEQKGYSMWPRIRLRAGLEYIVPDESVPFVGQNDGFLLDQARLGVEGQYRDVFDYRLIFDGISLLPGGGANDPTRPVLAAIRDAYLRFHLLESLDVTFGQFYLPSSRETLTPRGDFVFTQRSVAVSGIRRGHGFVTEGLGAAREVGVSLGKTGLPLGAFSADYMLALSNGNGTNVFGNDNKLPALSARAAIACDTYAGIGLFGRFNPRTVGELPSLFNETDLIAGGDLWVKALGIDLLLQGIFRLTSFDTVFADTDPSRNDTGYGLTGSLTFDEPFGLPLFGIRPGARLSFYDPRSAFDDDQITELTFGARYDLPADIPISALADFTLLLESEGARSIDNNRFNFILQFDL